MSDDITSPSGQHAAPEIERARQVFRFLKAFAERNVSVCRLLSRQLWTLPLHELPQHPTIRIGEVQLSSSGGPTAGDEDGDTTPLLRVQRPKLTRAPRPPTIINEFLRSGWEHCDGTIEVEPSRNVRRHGETITERFEDDPARVAALDEWRVKWGAWAEAERPAAKAMRIFERLYELRGRIERESEQVELMLGDGMLRWQQPEGSVDHPVLLQRVELEFDASVPEFRIVDADRGPELYAALLVGGETISPVQLNKLRVELEQGGYHPLAREATSGYLRRLVQLLGPHGTFHETTLTDPPGPDPVLTRDPVLFLRTRTAGYAAAFDRVLVDLETRRELPMALTRLVGVEPPPPPDPIESTSSPWGEPPDVLLSKPANMEQVQIARALERHRAVLVQGPPGTGKSHTIANLIGHLVAEGKRVLVTSHTTKALRVLRDQVVETLQPLCVAVLENDLEGRRQMELAVRGILSRLTGSSDEVLVREATQLADRREALNARIDAVTNNLRAAREGEYLPIVVGGESIAPADAARAVLEHCAGNEWIPGPLGAGAPLPLSPDELAELYATNGTITLDEEQEISAGLPDPTRLASVEEFEALVGALQATEPVELAPFWTKPAVRDELPWLQRFHELVTETAGELNRFEPWQRALVAAGHAGGTERELWEALRDQVTDLVKRWEAARKLLMDYDLTIPDSIPADEVRRYAAEILAHLEGGGSLGWTKLTLKPGWKTAVKESRVDGQPPSKPAHFRAIAMQVTLDEARRKLATRWARLAEPAGLPALATVASPFEPKLRDYAAQFDGLLDWWGEHWPAIAVAAKDAGFRWDAFREWDVARSEPAVPFDRDARLLADALPRAVGTRLAVAGRDAAIHALAALEELLVEYDGPMCSAMLSAVRARDAVAYDAAVVELGALARKTPAWLRREEMLQRLAAAAPSWATAIRHREGVHAGETLPGEPQAAWRWRQLGQEIERRAALGEVKLARQLEQLRVSVHEVTAELIDRLAWHEQLSRTDLRARQALQGWADTQRRIGRGTGRRVPALQVEARRLLERARDAVPVWIMPLSRVADSFDVKGGRFDVVIIDEASQADMTGLLAWYLGDRVVVVGDHEQVSPMAVGQQLDVMQGLITQYLASVPNSHLYDGTLSVYDLARQSFGGTIALREHFRCVPDIIEFSNELAYNGEIRPLRDPSAVARPHVVEYVVQPELGAVRTGKRNLAEARSIVALLKAATEMEEYEGKTMGAITLLGDEQAGVIQDIAVSLIDAVELERRRFVAGNSAQFQGDERHVVFLSMVDVPTGGLLTMRQNTAFKQRYNVAASRAKDQLWLVHSLDPNSDLRAGDLRRTLIEYVRDPGARRREAERAARRAESPFEAAVIERLVGAGYRVQPQVSVGQYRIDMVISDGVHHAALECDGDRFHGIDQIPADMARQAVLERAGWRFVRIRGTRFYRDPDATMAWVFEELTRLGVEPVGVQAEDVKADGQAGEFRDRVVRRAWEVMREQGWLPTEVLPESDDATASDDSTGSEGADAQSLV